MMAVSSACASRAPCSRSSCRLSTARFARADRRCHAVRPDPLSGDRCDATTQGQARPPPTSDAPAAEDTCATSADSENTSGRHDPRHTSWSNGAVVTHRRSVPRTSHDGVEFNVLVPPRPLEWPGGVAHGNRSSECTLSLDARPPIMPRCSSNRSLVSGGPGSGIADMVKHALDREHEVGVEWLASH